MKPSYVFGGQQVCLLFGAPGTVLAATDEAATRANHTNADGR